MQPTSKEFSENLGVMLLPGYCTECFKSCCHRILFLVLISASSGFACSWPLKGELVAILILTFKFMSELGLAASYG